jgi:hypothetical protein
VVAGCRIHLRQLHDPLAHARLIRSTRAFSSEVGIRSREENALKQK